MGLSNSQGRLTYVNLKDGKFATKNANGNMDFFTTLSGKITGIEIKDDAYDGKAFRKLCLIVQDADEKVLLQMRTESGYFRALSFAMPNVDLTKEVELSPKQELDSKKSTMFIKQDGNPVKWYFTKEHPHDLPPLVKTKFKGKDTWDNTDQSKYLEDMWLNVLRPKLGVPATVDNDEPGNDINDDLPF